MDKENKTRPSHQLEYLIKNGMSEAVATALDEYSQKKEKRRKRKERDDKESKWK
jgi:response regulator of citrate/malate metabolism